MHSLQNFKLSIAQSEHLNSHYKFVLGNDELWELEAIRNTASYFHRIPAIYFWVLDYKNQLNSIYIGKTKSLSNRIYNYASSFQPHSPNDFKLQVFHNFSHKEFPQSSLRLYFRPCLINELTIQEKIEISFFSPLLNTRLKANKKERENLQLAFSEYYISGFSVALQCS